MPMTRASGAVLTRRIAPVVDALVRRILEDEVGDPARLSAAALEATTAGLLDKVRSMPRFLGMPMLAMTGAFDAWARLRGGVPFRQQDRTAQRARIEEWRASPIGFCRNFVDFYEKMGVFVYYAHVEDEG